MDANARASESQLGAIGRVAAGMVRGGDRVGLGSGKAALAFVRMLGERVRTEGLKIVGVPTGTVTEKLTREMGIPLATLAEVAELDLCVDGSDEVDPQLNLIKGGGGFLTREKVVASVARRLVIVVGEEKLVRQLGEKFPVFVEVLEFARPVVTRKLTALGFTVTPRLNADGTLFLTDNGNPYLHCHTAKVIEDAAGLERAIRGIVGVVEVGLFVGMAEEVIVANVDGTISRLRRR